MKNRELNMAFPCITYNGMTMRQWYKGMIMQGMNANPDLMEAVTADELMGVTHFERMATSAGRQADAMIEEDIERKEINYE